MNDKPRVVACQDDGGVLMGFKSNITAALLPDGQNVSVEVMDGKTLASVEMNAKLFAAMCQAFIDNIKPQITA